jgi:hypothetical protein
MEKTQSKALVDRHGRGTAWEWHGMCESTFNYTQEKIYQFLSLPVICFVINA